ncbi:MAG: hypothetical protein HDR14_07130 [Lachnospiraceae bacterium]|nr:hypothetical protein [Lachnospiraceae bacterium]
MSKSDIRFKLLDLFNEDEISIVCKNTDLNLFLIPIKEKRYAKYAKMLGRLDKKSISVQKLLPKIAFDLYKKGEPPFRDAVAAQLEEYGEKFIEAISKDVKPEVCIDDIKGYDARAMANLYFIIYDFFAVDMSFELFLIILKVQNITVDEGIRTEIEKEIAIIRESRCIAEKYKEKLFDEFKEREKKLNAELENQKQELKKQINNARESNRKAQEKLRDTEQKLQKYESMTQDERKKLEAEWLSEYEKSLEVRKASDDLRWKTALEEAEAKHQKLLSDLEIDAERRRAELEESYQKQLISSKENLTGELAELTSQVAELAEKKKSLDAQINSLEQRQSELSSYIHELENIEEKYFESFEQRMIERKIETAIFKKLGFEKHDNQENAAVTVANTSNAVVVPANILSENVEYGEDVDCIEDFFNDYKENISLNFENETEIAGTVLAGVLKGMGIIATDMVCDCLSNALAALLCLSSPLLINIDSEKESLKGLVDIINENKSQVVCIKGILDNYNEILFTRICEVCRGKYLFFSISDLENLKMMSKAIMTYATVVDVENELHFPTDDCILIGNHDLTPFVPKMERKRSQEIYKNTFHRLVMKGYMKKSTAIEYSDFLQLYFSLVDGTILGEVVQKSIICACDFRLDDENLSDVLNKSGITVSVE